MQLKTRCVYLNGQFLPPQAAQVSVFDRGFIFGDGVYEVIPVYGGRLFRVNHHLQRLAQSLEKIGLASPLGNAAWQAIFARLVEEHGGGDQSLYLQITRGAAARDHGFPKDTSPTVFAYAQALTYPDASQLQTGGSAITLPDIRWGRCDIKAIALLPNVLMRQQALEQGATEAILIRDGQVTEGAASNIFAVHAGQLITPPKGALILPGITRDLVLELARAQNIACAETALSEAQLLTADEIWMTSSTKEIFPLTRLNGQPVGNGKPGPWLAKLSALYQDYKRAFRAGEVD